jgi:pimeloyl-ACP methyl ester carboxylesterase
MTRPDVLDEPWVHASGAGTPAVLVHGVYPGSPASFARQRPLAASALLIAVDRRGYGANPDRGGPLGWPADCQDLLRLLEALGGAHLVGHSYGGTVVGLAASRRPDLVRSLVLVDPALHTVAADDPDVADLLAREAEVARIAASTATTRAWAKAWVMRVVGADEDAAERFLAFWGERDWAMLEVVRRERPAGEAPVDYDTLAAAAFPKVVVVGGTAMSTGIAGGRRDRLGAALVEGLSRRIGAQVVVFEKATHLVMSDEPERLNDLLRTVWG